MNVRPNARLQPFDQISERFGLSIATLDKLVSTGELRVVEIPHVRRRLLDVGDVERAIESWKR